MKDYVVPTAQVEDEKAYTLRCRAMGFVLGVLHGQSGLDPEPCVLGGLWSYGKPEHEYTMPGGRQRWQQGTPACGFKDLGRAGDGGHHL